MSTIDDEQMQTRQKLEFLLTDEKLAYKQPITPPPVAQNHSWSSFYAGAGASLLLLAGGALGGYFFQQAHSDRASSILSPKSIAIPAQIPVVVSIPPRIDPRPVKTLHADGLSATRSVLTGVADPESLSASYYWTFSLRNSTSVKKEAQMQMVLPAGAVVSRATLWINGKAQEAAFNSTENVQRAYDWVVNGRRDPLIITQISANRVLIKASPVMPGQNMKLRIGMTVPMKLTANNLAELTLPYIDDSNVTISCKQDVHLTAPSTMSSNQVGVQNESTTGGSLLRGNIDAKSLEKLTISMARANNFTHFATRATHSDPPGFIVASIERDSQNNTSQMTLTKTLDRPNCPILASEHTAYRISYMWAKQEIDRLLQEDQRSQAVELASVYRVVSPVSGAVVLERSSDYYQMGLDRSMGRTLSYREQRLAQKPSPGNEREYSTSVLASTQSSSKAVSRRSTENKQALGIEDDLARDKDGSTDAVILAEAPISTPMPAPISASNHVAHGAMPDVTALDQATPSPPSPSTAHTVTPLTMALTAFNFAGPIAFLLIAMSQISRSRRKAALAAAIAGGWLICALYSPILSQSAAILAVTIWMLNRLYKMLHLSKPTQE